MSIFEDMFFIDTHCHISDEAFSGEEDAYIARAQEAGVGLMLQPDVDSRERKAMLSTSGWSISPTPASRARAM